MWRDDALAALDAVGTIQWMCSHCGPHPESTGRWCASGCGRDHGRMEQMIVLSPPFVQWVMALAAENADLKSTVNELAIAFEDHTGAPPHISTGVVEPQR
jgi:hypothetical protein